MDANAEAGPSRLAPAVPQGNPFPWFHLLQPEGSLDDLGSLTSAQLAAAWIIPHPDYDETVHKRKIAKLWRSRREKGRQLLGVKAIGRHATAQERQQDPFFGFELIPLDWQLPEDLDGLTSAQLAALPFHPTAMLQPALAEAAKRLFQARREADLAAGLAAPGSNSLSGSAQPNGSSGDASYPPLPAPPPPPPPLPAPAPASRRAESFASPPPAPPSPEPAVYSDPILPRSRAVKGAAHLSGPRPALTTSAPKNGVRVDLLKKRAEGSKQKQAAPRHLTQSELQASSDASTSALRQSKSDLYSRSAASALPRPKLSAADKVPAKISSGSPRFPRTSPSASPWAELLRGIGQVYCASASKRGSRKGKEKQMDADSMDDVVEGLAAADDALQGDYLGFAESDSDDEDGVAQQLGFAEGDTDEEIPSDTQQGGDRSGSEMIAAEPSQSARTTPPISTAEASEAPEDGVGEMEMDLDDDSSDTGSPHGLMQSDEAKRVEQAEDVVMDGASASYELQATPAMDLLPPTILRNEDEPASPVASSAPTSADLEGAAKASETVEQVAPKPTAEQLGSAVSPSGPVRIKEEAQDQPVSRPTDRVRTAQLARSSALDFSWDPTAPIVLSSPDEATSPSAQRSWPPEEDRKPVIDSTPPLAEEADVKPLVSRLPTRTPARISPTPPVSQSVSARRPEAPIDQALTSSWTILYAAGLDPAMYDDQIWNLLSPPHLPRPLAISITKSKSTRTRKPFACAYVAYPTSEEGDLARRGLSGTIYGREGMKLVVVANNPTKAHKTVTWRWQDVDYHRVTKLEDEATQRSQQTPIDELPRRRISPSPHPLDGLVSPIDTKPLSRPQPSDTNSHYLPPRSASPPLRRNSSAAVSDPTIVPRQLLEHADTIHLSNLPPGTTAPEIFRFVDSPALLGIAAKRQDRYDKEPGSAFLLFDDAAQAKNICHLPLEKHEDVLARLNVVLQYATVLLHEAFQDALALPSEIGTALDPRPPPHTRREAPVPARHARRSRSPVAQRRESFAGPASRYSPPYVRQPTHPVELPSRPPSPPPWNLNGAVDLPSPPEHHAPLPSDDLAAHSNAPPLTDDLAALLASLDPSIISAAAPPTAAPAPTTYTAPGVTDGLSALLASLDPSILSAAPAVAAAAPAGQTEYDPNERLDLSRQL